MNHVWAAASSAGGQSLDLNQPAFGATAHAYAVSLSPAVIAVTEPQRSRDINVMFYSYRDTACL